MEITKNLSIVPIKVDHGQQKLVATGTNFYYVIDVSGSMSSELKSIRTQLKNQLTTLLKEDDRISIVWFSSDNQAGILQESVQITDLVQLENLKKAIDRYLVPMGCTAFRKPLDLVREIIERANSSNPNCLLFLTDGYNNDCKWSDVMDNLRKLEDKITSATFVEYGYNADSKRLSEMAECIGGDKISADSFESYEPQFTKKLSTPLLSAKRTEVIIPFTPSLPFVFAITDALDVKTYSTEGKIMVESNVKTVYAFTDKPNSDKISDEALYAAVHTLADKLMVNRTEEVLAKLGDVALYKYYINAFGKQKLFDFKDMVLNCVVNPDLRFINGKSDSIEIDDNAFCVINLIDTLQSLEAIFYPFSPELKYNRISRAKEKSGTLTDEQQKLLSEAKTVAELSELAKRFEVENPTLEFKVKDKTKGYSLKSLVFNEDRANVSVLFCVDGSVKLPKNQFKLEEIDTFRFFTYNIVRDGIVNFDTLPIAIESGKTLPLGMIEYVTSGGESKDGLDFYNINIKAMPVINRSMFKSLSASQLLRDTYELVKLKTANKVFKLAAEPKTNTGLVEKYGSEAAEWLMSLGFSDGSGFAPKEKQAESTDSYVAVELAVKIAGLSSIPKVEDVVKKIAGGKNLTASDSLMKPYIEDLNSMTKLVEVVKTVNPNIATEFTKAFIKAKVDSINKAKNDQMRKISENKFAFILSRSWFPEFKTIDDNVLEIEIDGNIVKGTFEYSEKQIAI